MRCYYAIIFFALVLIMINACKQSGDSTNQTREFSKDNLKKSMLIDSCDGRHDTIFYLSFTKDTATKDFHGLLNFIESKGELNRYDRKHKILSSTNDKLILDKVLCPDKNFDTPIERWVLKSVYSISYSLNGHRPLKGTKDIYPSMRITQYNFKTAAEKEIAYAKMQEIRWGDPLIKWNEFYLLSSKTRIIILELKAPIFTQVTEKYRDIIQKEWIEKYNY